MSTRSRAALIAFGLLVLSPLIPVGAQGGLDTVVARIGTQSITARELAAYTLRYYGKNTLEGQVNRTILLQEAERLKVEIDEVQAKTRIAELKRQGGERLRAALEAQGVSEAIWEAGVRDAMLAEKLLDVKWPVKDQDLVRILIRYARLSSKEQANQLISEARRGVNFPVLVGQRSIDKENGGLVSDKPFFRIDQPWWFGKTLSAGLRPGQVTRQPIASREYWIVIKLEELHEASSLKPEEREKAVQRIRAFRMSRLVPNTRRRYRVEYPTPLERVQRDPAMPGGTVLAKIGDDVVTWADLREALLGNWARTALEQMVDRAIVARLAREAGVSVTEAEVRARVTAARGNLESQQKAFQAALAADGITEESWTERVRYIMLAEKVINARFPARPEDLERLTVRYIRVAAQADADDVLRRARGGMPFEQLQRQVSLDARGDGFIRPRAFFRVEQPTIFQAVAESRVQAGQVVPRVVEAGSAGFLVLKLEARFGPDTLTARERDAALRRLNAGRMAPFLDSIRKEVQVEYPVPLRTVIAGLSS